MKINEREKRNKYGSEYEEIDGNKKTEEGKLKEKRKQKDGK